MGRTCGLRHCEGLHPGVGGRQGAGRPQLRACTPLRDFGGSDRHAQEPRCDRRDEGRSRSPDRPGLVAPDLSRGSTLLADCRWPVVAPDATQSAGSWEDQLCTRLWMPFPRRATPAPGGSWSRPWPRSRDSTRRRSRSPTLRSSARVATSGLTEIIELPNRGHGLVIDSGWREVADTSLRFIERYLRADSVAAPDHQSAVA